MPGTSSRRALHFPTKATEIPDEWFRIVFDGNLWRLQTADLPFQITHLQTFRLTFIRRCEALGNRKASLRFSPDGTCLFIQARFVKHGEIEPKLPFEEAWDAPKIPPIAPVEHLRPERGEPVTRWDAGTAAKMPLKPVDHSSVVASMLAMQDAVDESDTPARMLVGHPVIGWAMADCDCDTENFRTHRRGCRCYPLLGLVEHQLKRLRETPEAWARKNTP